MDKILQKLKRGSMLIIGGRPYMGKNILALNIMEKLCEQSEKCMYFTDMPKNEVEEQLLLQSLNFAKDDTPDTISQKFLKAINEIEKWQLQIHCYTEFKLNITKIEELISKNMPDKVFINFTRNTPLKLINLEPVKNLAEKFEVAVILLANIHFENELEQRPKLSIIKERKEFEKYADEILLLFRDSYYNGGSLRNSYLPMEIIFAKTESESIELKYNWHTLKILD